MTEPQEKIDLRSDTVTQPGKGMRKAMAEAIVGDDVLGDDPTIKALEERVADILGKEAALFCPSGTMVNQIAISIQTRPGDEVICEEGAHLLYYESGAPGFLSGVMMAPIKGHNGMISAQQVKQRIKKGDIHYAWTRLVCLENTHNRAGGRLIPLESMANLSALCKQEGLFLHLDGARLWNASVASGIPLKSFAQHADTVGVCLSKALGAPIGSLLASTHENIALARRLRKRLGGGMRQVGILGAAGLYALDHNFERLAEDHANARLLADGLCVIDGIDLDPTSTETNIVLFHLNESAPMNAPELTEVLSHYGVLMLPFSERSIRAVTHMDVSAGQIKRAIEVVTSVLTGQN